MKKMIIVFMLLLGLAFGSFITALTWRLHEHKDFVAGRSQCEACGHQLSALDLIPVFSWVWLRGRCRYCGGSVSWQNPAIELAVAGLFVVSYLYWPLGFTSWQAGLSFGILLVFIVMLVALLVYDFRWMLLPDGLVFPLIALGLVDVALRLGAANQLTIGAYVMHVVLGAAALGGLYAVLYAVSKGRWVGLGDVKLGLFIGLVLGWQGALMTLFLANLLGLLCVVPGLIGRRMTMNSRLPFGPFLIISFVIVGLWGSQLVDWYLSAISLR